MFEGKGVSECSLNTWRDEAKIKISNTRTHGIFEYSEFLVLETMENFQNLNKNSLRSTIQNYNSLRVQVLDRSLTRVLAPPQLDPKANGAPVLGVRQDSNLASEDRRHQSMRHHRRRIGIPSQHLETVATVTPIPFFPRLTDVLINWPVNQTILTDDAHARFLSIEK